MGASEEVDWDAASAALQRSVSHPPAFADFVACVECWMFHVAWRRLGNEQDARDAVQMACLKVFQSSARYDGGLLKPWLATIVQNAAIDIWRSNQRQSGADTVIDMSQFPTTEKDPDLGECWERAWDRLSAQEQRVLQIYHIEPFGPYAACAEKLGIRVGQFTMQLFHARRKFAQYLKQVGIDMPGWENEDESET